MTSPDQNNRRTPGTPALLVLLTSLIAAPAGAQIPTHPIALSGQPAPDGNGIFSVLAHPHINEAGEVVFRAELTGTSPGAGVGLFRGQGGPLTQIARTGQSAPDGNGTIMFISPFAFDLDMNDSGQVAFYAGLVGVDGVGGERWGHFLGDGQTTVTIARHGQVTPHGTLTSSLSRLAVLNSAAQVALVDPQRGVFRAEGGSLTPVAIPGQSTPQGTLQFLHEGLGMNDAGHVVFGVNNVGIFRWDGSTLNPVAVQGQAAPGGDGTFTFTIPSGDVFTPAASINSAGQVLFEAFLAGSPQRYGIFLQTGSTLSEVFRATEVVHQHPGTFSAFDAPRLNDAGQVAFITDSQFGPIASGLHRYDGGLLTSIAHQGQTSPDGNGTFARFFLRSLNDAGEMLFLARLEDTSGGDTDDFALFLANGTELLPLVRKGEPFDVGGGELRTITAIGWSELNDLNQMAFALGFADGTSGVFVATIPEPAALTLPGATAMLTLSRRRRFGRVHHESKRRR